MPGGAASLLGNLYFTTWSTLFSVIGTLIWYVRDWRQMILDVIEEKQQEYELVKKTLRRRQEERRARLKEKEREEREEGEREESCKCLKVLELYKGNYVYAKEDGHDILEGNSVDAVASGEPNGGQGKREERGDDKPNRSLFVDDWHMNFLL